jgi:hypothetical protein
MKYYSVLIREGAFDKFLVKMPEVYRLVFDQYAGVFTDDDISPVIAEL